MQTVHPLKAGLALGVTLGTFHLMWALLVASGWAQPVVDFLFWLHFIKPVYTVAPFDPSIALLLVAVTAAAGFFGAFIFSLIWKALQPAAGLRR
jgi:hypothetical protein